MQITSYSFFIFVAGIVFIYHLLNNKQKKYWLLFASYVFYGIWAWQAIVILVIMTAANFYVGYLIKRSSTHKQKFLWAGVILNIGILAIFKYADFYLPQLDHLLGILGFTSQFNSLKILLPLGLSFLTLQAISFLVDLYRNQIQLPSDWVNFALYFSYFPKLIAGPIERPGKFLSQLEQPKVVDNESLYKGMSLILLGLFRKMVIGNFLLERTIERFYQGYSGTAFLVIWLIAYSFAIYNDFAGYTSIVRGVSLLFGIELSVNFKQPYFAKSFSDFWNRWHISFSHWLRDYIFYPLSRSLLRKSRGKRNTINLLVPPLITMFISALWHGVSSTMLIWGGLHGIYLITEQLLLRYRIIKPENQSSARYSFISRIVIFSFVILAWIPFSGTSSQSMAFILGLRHYHIIDPSLFYLYPLLALVAISLVLDWLQYSSDDELFMFQWRQSFQALFWAIIILAIMIAYVINFSNAFIYQNF